MKEHQLPEAHLRHTHPGGPTLGSDLTEPSNKGPCQTAAAAGTRGTGGSVTSA